MRPTKYSTKRPVSGLRKLAVALLLFAPVLTAGCGGLPIGAPPETVRVAGGAVVIGGPQGYCVDRGASRIGADSPFVLLGSCASIARDARAGAPAQPGVLTATVSPPGDGPPFAASLPQLGGFLASPAGRAALARDGRAGSVAVLDTQGTNEAMLVRLTDRSPAAIPGTAETYWRGLFEVNGRLVTVSVMSFEDRPMGRDSALAALRGTIARIRRESAVSGPV